jgi:hypothetical protein
MSKTFEYDVFLSYSSKDKKTVHALAERLKQDGLRVWLDAWQPYPVMLVIHTSDGKIRWMNVTDYLQRHGPDAQQVVFEGEPFTAPNVARLRDRVLG